MPKVLSRIWHSKLTFPLVCLALVLALSAVVSLIKDGSVGVFFRIYIAESGALVGPLITILDRSSELVILAVGMTLVASCSKGADISVGAVMSLAGACSVWVLGMGPDRLLQYHVPEYVVPWIVGMLAAIVVGFICGMWHGFLVAKLRIVPMVATLILFVAARGLSRVIANGAINYVDPPSYRWLGGRITLSDGSLFPIPTPTFVAAGVVIIAAVVLRYTALGMNIQAVGINDRASGVVGLKPDRIIFLAFVVCGVCAGIASTIGTSRFGGIDTFNLGKMIELDAILAVALGGNSLAGGKFSLSGSVIGAITIQALSTVLFALSVPANALPFYKAIVVIAIVILQSPELRPMVNKAVAKVRALLPRKQRSLVVQAKDGEQ